MKLTNITGVHGVEDITAPPKAQSSTSLAKMLYLAPLLPIAYGLYLAGADKFLSPDNAADVKDVIKSMAQAVAVSVTGGIPLALAGRSLLLTHLKGKAQMPSVPDTVNAAGDVNVGTQAQASPIDELPEYQGVRRVVGAGSIGESTIVDLTQSEQDEPLPIAQKDVVL